MGTTPPNPRNMLLPTPNIPPTIKHLSTPFHKHNTTKNIYIYIYIYIYVYVCVCARVCACACERVCARAHVCARVRACACVREAPACVRVCTRMRVCMRVCTSALVYARVGMTPPPPSNVLLPTPRIYPNH